MGLRFVKGLGEKDGRTIEAVRAPGFSLEDLVRRTLLPEGTLVRLAETGALESFGLPRREAIWRVKGLIKERGTVLPCSPREEAASFKSLTDFETIAWDYRSSQHSPRGHPIAPLRKALLRRDLPSARTVNKQPDGKRVRYAGLVICRQRPGTASGVVFLTLEDETGFVNVVIWPKVYERFSLLVKTTTFLGITGRVQSQDGVVHVVAETFWEPELTVRPESGGSRDFH